MLKLVYCEFCKLKRRKLFYIAFLTTFIMPLFYTLLLSDRGLDNLLSVVREENGFLLLIPLSVVLAANLFFAEYDCDTLKNLLCIPVSKGGLAAAKMLVLLLFDIGYMAAGAVFALLLTMAFGGSLMDCGVQLLITLGTGVLLWAAALPCVLVVIWCNQSYIISVIIAFAYTAFGYLLHISDAVCMVPLGLNVQTFLPVPVIFRWLYQFHQMEGVGGEMLAFYKRFQPYFISTPVAFSILMAEAAVCMLGMVIIYKRQKQ